MSCIFVVFFTFGMPSMSHVIIVYSVSAWIVCFKDIHIKRNKKCLREQHVDIDRCI